MHEPAIVDAVLKLAAKPAKECLLCYLGTATYDLPAPREAQTSSHMSQVEPTTCAPQVLQKWFCASALPRNASIGASASVGKSSLARTAALLATISLASLSGVEPI